MGLDADALLDADGIALLAADHVGLTDDGLLAATLPSAGALLHGGTGTPASLGEDPDDIRVRGTASRHGSLLVCAGTPSCVGASVSTIHPTYFL